MMTATQQLDRFGACAVPHASNGTVLVQVRCPYSGDQVAVELSPEEARHFAYFICAAYYRAKVIGNA